jgi:hypothetical protein
MKIVQERVIPERELNKSRNLREQWWVYERGRTALYAAISGMKRVLVIPRHAKYMICAWIPEGIIYSDATCVIASEKDSDFAILQCTFHDIWARLCGSTLETRMRYTPTDCFETFPFPVNMQGLGDIGERYYLHRQAIMLDRQEGLTKTYNSFHDLHEIADDIVLLRELHKEMDKAVGQAYGWDDLLLGHGFHETKQGLRYTISEEARREVLGRLLKLNHERYAEEVAMGLHEKGAKKEKGKQATKGSKDRKSAHENLDVHAILPTQETLFG